MASCQISHQREHGASGISNAYNQTEAMMEHQQVTVSFTVMVDLGDRAENDDGKEV